MEIVASAVVAAGSSGVTAVSGGGAVDGRAAARFSEIMESGAPPATSAVAQSGAVPALLPTENTLGARILNGLNGASAEFRHSLSEVTSVLDGVRSVTTADMLKMQLNLTQVSIQYDLIGKAVSRATQNIDQLLKIQ